MLLVSIGFLGIYFHSLAHAQKDLARKETGATVRARNEAEYKGKQQAIYAIDGDPTTKWNGNTVKNWLHVFLPETVQGGEIEVKTSSEDARWHLDVRTRNRQWSTVGKERKRAAGQTYRFTTSGKFREIRIVFTGSSAPRNHIFKQGISEIRVFRSKTQNQLKKTKNPAQRNNEIHGIFDGAEDGDTSNWSVENSSDGSFSIITHPTASGKYAIKISRNSNPYTYIAAERKVKKIYHPDTISAQFRYPSHGNNKSFQIINGNGETQWQLFIDNNGEGNIVLRDKEGKPISSKPVDTRMWHQFSFKNINWNQGKLDWFLNGVSVKRNIRIGEINSMSKIYIRVGETNDSIFWDNISLKSKTKSSRNDDSPKIKVEEGDYYVKFHYAGEKPEAVDWKKVAFEEAVGEALEESSKIIIKKAVKAAGMSATEKIPVVFGKLMGLGFGVLSHSSLAGLPPTFGNLQFITDGGLSNSIHLRRDRHGQVTIPAHQIVFQVHLRPGVESSNKGISLVLTPAGESFRETILYKKTMWKLPPWYYSTKEDETIIQQSLLKDDISFGLDPSQKQCNLALYLRIKRESKPDEFEILDSTSVMVE